MEVPVKSHTLYAVPFSCSLAVNLTLAQHAMSVSLRWVRRGAARQIEGLELAHLNPKRKVPALVLPDGELLTEMVGVLLYLDEAHGPARPPEERRRLIEWLSFLATELHKSVLAPAYDAAVSDEARADARDRLLPPVLAILEDRLSGRDTLLGGETPSGADAYLLWGLLLLRNLWPETVATTALTAFRHRMLAQPWVPQVLALEREVLAALD